MGREAEGDVSYLGQTGAVKAVLESDVLILRGEVRARLARGDLAGWVADGDNLRLLAAGVPLLLTLGAKQVAAWVRALDKPLPTLMEKLGLSSDTPGHAMGSGVSNEITAAMAGASADLGHAAMLVAVLDSRADLEAALVAAKDAAKPVWCVYRKGKAAVGDAGVRDAFRAMGWRDVKACAVSAGWTATRYAPPKGR